METYLSNTVIGGFCPQMSIIHGHIPTLLLDPSKYRLPESELAWQECITLPHNSLLGNDRDIEDIVHAFRKVADHHDQLPSFG